MNHRFRFEKRCDCNSGMARYSSYLGDIDSDLILSSSITSSILVIYIYDVTLCNCYCGALLITAIFKLWMLSEYSNVFK